MTLGMGMTEKQGGTDVRANSSVATPTGDSIPSPATNGFSRRRCATPFWSWRRRRAAHLFSHAALRPDGSVNALRLQRLKDKLGNRSNASSEIEFAEAFAWRVGDEGAGVRTIIQMVQLTRLDCALASAGFMRMAVAQAAHHCRYRSVFQKHLYDQPMMRAVLADLALEVEGAVALVMRLARAFDRADTDPHEAAYARLVTPAAKYWVCKTAPSFIYEAMECVGGNGYVEESVLPRLYREAPVNAIWEGSGNVMCLDVLRALKRDKEAADLFGDLGREASDLTGDGAAPFAPMNEFASEATARVTVGKLAVLAAAAALRATAPPALVEAFVQTRLVQPHGALYGADAIKARTAELLLQRALPEELSICCDQTTTRSGEGRFTYATTVFLHTRIPRHHTSGSG